MKNEWSQWLFTSTINVQKIMQKIFMKILWTRWSSVFVQLNWIAGITDNTYTAWECRKLNPPTNFRWTRIVLRFFLVFQAVIEAESMILQLATLKFSASDCNFIISSHQVFRAVFGWLTRKFVRCYKVYFHTFRKFPDKFVI